jgi:hypothetical protein
MAELTFTVDGQDIAASIENLVIAGWTGRDAKAVEDHIAELEALGVSRPRTVPCFYRLGSNLLTASHELEVCGENSSGEVEFVLVSLPEGLFVGVGSDLTDRVVEAYGVTVSKQVCPKPVSRELWRYEDVAGHWDRLTLRAWVTRGNSRVLYQQGSVTRMRTPDDLIRLFTNHASLAAGTLMYCGTLPVEGQIGFGERFEVELEDPVRQRVLKHEYAVRSLSLAD